MAQLESPRPTRPPALYRPLRLFMAAVGANLATLLTGEDAADLGAEGGGGARGGGDGQSTQGQEKEQTAFHEPHR